MKLAIGGGLRWTVVLIAIGAALALMVYVSERSAERVASTAPGASTALVQHAPGGMTTALARLESRLRAGGGSKEDWELLAKTYDFLGRKSDAKNARAAHVVAAPSAADAQPAGPWSPDVVADFMRIGGMISTPEPAGDASPSSPGAALPDTAAQRQIAELRGAVDRAMAMQDFNAAKSAYEQLADLGAMSAQSWADYADITVTLNGGHWDAAAQRDTEAALKLDATNQKALWLLASSQHDAGHYASAIATWNRLLALTPSAAPEAKVFAANLAEDQQLNRRFAPD